MHLGIRTPWGKWPSSQGGRWRKPLGGQSTSTDLYLSFWPHLFLSCPFTSSRTDSRGQVSHPSPAEREFISGCSEDFLQVHCTVACLYRASYKPHRKPLFSAESWRNCTKGRVPGFLLKLTKGQKVFHCSPDHSKGSSLL